MRSPSRMLSRGGASAAGFRAGVMWAAICVLGPAAVAGCGQDSQPPSVPAAPPALRFPHPDRVAVIVLENRSYEQVIGSRSAPYLNGLAHRFALATRFYAITHPSLPNYIALTGGSAYGIRSDCAGCVAAGPNVVRQLDDAGISWKAYFEGLDSNRRPGPSGAVPGTVRASWASGRSTAT